jgi:hypothetical protein
MTDTEAIQILMSCRSLAGKLVHTGVDLKLEKADRFILSEFERLRRAKFTYTKLKQLSQRVGLAPADLGMLNWLCNQASAIESR